MNHIDDANKKAPTMSRKTSVKLIRSLIKGRRKMNQLPDLTEMLKACCKHAGIEYSSARCMKYTVYDACGGVHPLTGVCSDPLCKHAAVKAYPPAAEVVEKLKAWLDLKSYIGWQVRSTIIDGEREKQVEIFALIGTQLAYEINVNEYEAFIRAFWGAFCREGK